METFYSSYSMDNLPGYNTIPGLVLWVRAEDIMGTNHDEPVAIWRDRSENKSDLFVPTSRTCPRLYKNATPSGKPSIKFSGSLFSTPNILSSKTECTVIIVWAPYGSSIQILFEQGASSFSIESTGTITNPLFYIGNSGGASAAASSAGVFEVLSTVARAGTLTMAKNNVAGTPVSFSGNTGTDPLSIGGRIDGSYLTGSFIAEMLIFDRDITDPLISQITAELMANYGI